MKNEKSKLLFHNLHSIYFDLLQFKPSLRDFCC